MSTEASSLRPAPIRLALLAMVGCGAFGPVYGMTRLTIDGAASANAAGPTFNNSDCSRDRPSARHGCTLDTGMSHVGFRCAKSPAGTGR